MVTVRLDGPNQAAALALLWEAMLCRLLPDRLERRDLRRQSSSRQLRRITGTAGWEEHDNLLRKLYGVVPAYPDHVWQAVYLQTMVQLPFEIHAALWSAYADPQTGELPAEDLDRHVRLHLPMYVEGSEFTHKFMSFLATATNDRVDSEATFTAPHLYIRCSPPALVLRDRDDNVHCPEGPAMVFGDGTSIYYWRGQIAPAEWFPEPGQPWLEQQALQPGRKIGRYPSDRVSPNALLPRPEHRLPEPAEALGLENLELRRVAIEMLGWDNVLRGLRVQLIDEDPDPEIGTLIAVMLPTPSPWDRAARTPHQFLQVRCGTGRTFSLAVPLECRTAREANAWTYGLSPEDYAPEVRT